MKILADENIPYVEEVFGSLGEVRCCAGRNIGNEDIEDAEILLVRSVTPVGPGLLDGTMVRFVGTATIGTDHIDTDYLADRGVAFASAAGSNSNSVAEYVITSLLTMAKQYEWQLAGRTIGIVGVGNIGSKVAQKAFALGMQPVLNDPPRARKEPKKHFVSLEEALHCDIITFHVPLTRGGEDATYHLLNEDRLRTIRPGAVVINSSRGSVVDNAALKKCLQEEYLGPVVLDVWEGEPEIDLELLNLVEIGTPHIAGYSLDGKVNGTMMLYEAVCKLWGCDAQVTAKDLLPDPPVGNIELDVAEDNDQALIARAMTSIYDIMRDDASLRGLADQEEKKRGSHFDLLRKQYPVRRESHNTKVIVNGVSVALETVLKELGFQVV
ncbi:MAG: 4-phosphoerythronate dehydrogenase PdxB [Sedimentisphaerales bacterium]|nr:4-phosphoerythronate dehydrogenase PdxB [Sedimentisphaerales bacterium]